MEENKNQELYLKDKTDTETDFAEKRIVDDGIFLYYKQKHRKFKYSDIIWIEASGSYCNIKIANEKQIIIVYTLHQLYDKLPKELFVRIHRSYIVNIYFVTAFFHKMLYVEDKMLPISSPYMNEVMACFNCIDNRRVLVKQKEENKKPYAESEK